MADEEDTLETDYDTEDLADFSTETDSDDNKMDATVPDPDSDGDAQ